MKKQKTMKTPILLMLALLLGMLATTVLAQNGDGGETAVVEPDLSGSIEIISETRMPSGATTTEARIYADRFTFISSGNGNTAYGSWYDAYFGNQPGGYGAMRLMMRFPVDQIPAGSIISSSQLNIHLNSVTDGQTERVYNAYTLGGGWTDETVTWNNRPGRSSTAAWNATLTSNIGWRTTDATNLTRTWYDNPGGNHGIEIEGEEQPERVHTRVYASNHSVNSPYLTVYYTTHVPSAPPDAWITTISPYVQALGSWWTTGTFNIQWAAADHSGTGIKYYDMYTTSNNGTNWNIGQAQVTHTSTPFTLGHNQTFGFYVRARDNMDQEGAAPSGSGSIQKSVRIDAVAPVVTIQPLPAHSDHSGQVLNWSGGMDDGSGIKNYDVQWRVAGGTWQTLFTETTLTSYFISGGDNGTTYEFRARGRDQVGNVPEWGAAQAWTTVWLEPAAYIASFNPSPIYTATVPANGDSFQVSWAGDAGPDTSIVSFSLRYQKPGNSTWIAWHTDVNAAMTSDNFVMTDNTTDFPDGIYTFQVKAKDSAGTEGAYHEETQGTIIVDREDPRMTDNVVYLPVVFK